MFLLCLLKNYFRQMSETNYFIKSKGQKILSTENIIKRHGG